MWGGRGSSQPETRHPVCHVLIQEAGGRSSKGQHEWPKMEPPLSGSWPSLTTLRGEGGRRDQAEQETNMSLTAWLL